MSLNTDSRFSSLPNIDIERSKFSRNCTHKTTLNAGELIPIFCDEVLPGDTFTMDTFSLVRMSTPIFPVMDNAYLDMYYFFVPNRLLWEHWKEFNGENSSGYWTQPIDYSVPQLVTGDEGSSFDKGSLGDYFGIPTNTPNLSVSALPFRAYTLIWNEFFRDQNSMPPAFFSKDDNDNSAVSRSSCETYDDVLVNAVYGSHPLYVSKYHDYFTSCLPAPQKGAAVDLPLYQNDIPVYTGPAHSLRDVSYTMSFAGTSENGGPPPSGVFPLGVVTGASPDDTDAYLYADNNGAGLGNPTYGLVPNNLYADVQNVAVATISQLRQAFQIQRLYEKDARGGTRYREILKCHFGVDSPDSRMQVPEYLGGKRIPINVDQVLQTSATNEVSPQGNTSAYSLTSDKDSSFTKSFTEHGFIIGLACVRTEHTYQQGIERFWSRKSRFDYYWPSLAHISEQPVLVKEIYATGSSHDDDAFGYQEAWADYRYKPNRVSGAFRSNVNGSLDAWHYADYYEDGNDNFVLNAEWLNETKVNIDRTLAVQSSLEDQFICDFYFKLDCVRPMPLYSVPGLIDHF